mmetsp:Transcript_10497/g.12769  ORF Transcript_10497/g.12769 Transcript_10497/m.12769 type:complete len:190 (+) Transcript_10497:35-604(+)
MKIYLVHNLSIVLFLHLLRIEVSFGDHVHSNANPVADETSREIVSEALGSSFCPSISATAIIERHDDEDDHGDVCRFQTSSHGFYCPEVTQARGRKAYTCTASTKAPYCVMVDRKTKVKSPCRVPLPDSDIWDAAALLVKENPKWSPLRALRIARAHQNSINQKNAELEESMDSIKLENKEETHNEKIQ